MKRPRDRRPYFLQAFVPCLGDGHCTRCYQTAQLMCLWCGSQLCERHKVCNECDSTEVAAIHLTDVRSLERMPANEADES